LLKFTAALPAAVGTIYPPEVTIYRSAGGGGGGQFTAALPAAEATIYHSASNELRHSASAASFPAGTLTPLP